MRNIICTLSSLALLPLMAANAFAFAETPESCALIDNEKQRLTCYDSFFRQSNTNQQSLIKEASTESQLSQQNNRRSQINENTAATITESNRAVIADKEARLAKIKEDGRTNAALVREVSRAPNPPNKPLVDASTKGTAANGDKNPEALFGAERIQKDDVSIPDDVTYTVSAISENQRKVRTFTFSNDQVWREVSKNRFKVREGDTVIISKGTFSSYYLSREGMNRKTQVKRIR